jgi:hypothetical protein
LALQSPIQGHHPVFHVSAFGPALMCLPHHATTVPKPTVCGRRGESPVTSARLPDSELRSAGCPPARDSTGRPRCTKGKLGVRPRRWHQVCWVNSLHTMPSARRPRLACKHRVAVRVHVDTRCPSLATRAKRALPLNSRAVPGGAGSSAIRTSTVRSLARAAGAARLKGRRRRISAGACRCWRGR